MAYSPSSPELTVPSSQVQICEEHRPYRTFGSFFLTVTTLGASAWVFLIGSVLPSIGDARLTIVGFLCGLLLGAVVCVLGVALPAFRYAVDSVDVSKAFLGGRGALLPLSGVLLTALAWAAVVNSMIARGFVFLLFGSSAVFTSSGKGVCLVFYVAGIILCWLLLRGGYHLVQRASNVVGPGFLIVALLCLILLVSRFGFSGLWVSGAGSTALTSDRHKSLAYALEFGLAFSLAWWPFIGGLYRMIRHRRHTINPFMLGTLCGAGFCSIVAALGAAHYRTADPVVWIVRLAGPVLGTSLVAIVLMMNIPAMALLVYFAASALRQLRVMARVRWDRLVAIALVPVALGVYDMDWVLVHVTAVATYGGLMFLGVSAIAIVDFHILRRGRLHTEDLSGVGRRGPYWFWGGVNWIAMIVVGLGAIVYLTIYDPISLEARWPFRYLGAGLPVMFASGVIYYVLMRLLAPLLPARGDDPRAKSNTGSYGSTES